MDELVPYVRFYLAEVRPRFVHRGDHGGFWISAKLGRLDPGRIYDIVRARVFRKFGKLMSLHDFRRAAATFVATHAPEKIGIIPGVLQHSSPEVGERWYNLAGSVEAGRQHAAAIAGMCGRGCERPTHQMGTDTMRAAIYAGYSSENQRDASIEDQIRICRAEIDRRGCTFVSVHFDRATSGASTLRSGYQRLLEVARAGEADIVVSEALDRLSRDQADIANLYKQLSYLGVSLFTLSEGDITELHVGLKGTMNALFLKDLPKKTHRGLEGRVREGRSGEGLSFGYSGVSGDLGARHFVPSEAETVRRIFRDFVAGKSPRNIARQLNNEGVPGPRGGGWRDTTIRGHILRDTGILNNQLYIGQLVWNRLSYAKEPTTGRRRSRAESEGGLDRQAPSSVSSMTNCGTRQNVGREIFVRARASSKRERVASGNTDVQDTFSPGWSFVDPVATDAPSSAEIISVAPPRGEKGPVATDGAYAAARFKG